MYEWIIFDMDGTLVDFDSAEDAAFTLTFNALKERPDLRTLKKMYDRINHRLWRQMEEGLIGAAALRVERFRVFLDETGIEADPETLSDTYLAHLSGQHTLIPGAIQVLESLQGPYRLALMTNGFEVVQRKRIERTGIARFVEHVFISETVGFHKPDPRIFDHALEAMGSPRPQRVLMVGDSLESDILGGNRAGLDTCWFNPAGRDAGGSVRPDFEIAELTMLMGELEARG